MVMVHESSGSEAEEGRHDRFRGERVLGPSEHRGLNRRRERPIEIRKEKDRVERKREDRRRREREEERRRRRDKSRERETPPSYYSTYYLKVESREERNRSGRNRKKKKKHRKKERGDKKSEEDERKREGRRREDGNLEGEMIIIDSDGGDESEEEGSESGRGSSLNGREERNEKGESREPKTESDKKLDKKTSSTIGVDSENITFKKVQDLGTRKTLKNDKSKDRELSEGKDIAVCKKLQDLGTRKTLKNDKSKDRESSEGKDIAVCKKLQDLGTRKTLKNDKSKDRESSEEKDIAVCSLENEKSKQVKGEEKLNQECKSETNLIDTSRDLNEERADFNNDKAMDVKENVEKDDSNKKETVVKDEGEMSEKPLERFIGPQRGPAVVEMYGPAIPEGLDRQKAESESIEDTYGPALPPSRKPEEEMVGVGNEEEERIGPLPPGQESSSDAHHALDIRARQLKIQMENKGQTAVRREEDGEREEWMTSLPEDRGMILDPFKPRKFRTREAPKRDNSWALTPSQKAEEAEKEKSEEKRLGNKKQKKNDEIEKETKKHKKRVKSLLEEHQSALKKKKKEEKDKCKKEERKPFSREDISGPNLSSTQKRSIVERAKLLDSRFSSGKEKFL